MKFRRFLGLGSQSVVGVDISSSSVKMVQLEPENSGYRMAAAGHEPISHWDLSEGTSAKQETIEAVRRCYTSSGFTTDQVVCSVSGPEVAVRFFEFPSMPADEIASAVRLEAEQTCPIDMQQCTMDYVLLPSQQGDDPTGEATVAASAKTRGVMVTATNKVIQKRKEIVEAANLRCVMMDVDSLAMLNCFMKQKEPNPDESIVLMNVGNSYTNLSIVADKQMPFIRDLPYAAADVIAQIEEETHVPVETIRQIFETSAGDHPEKDQVQHCLRQACEKLIDEVNGTLRYFAARHHLAPVERIFVCGGFSLTKGFVEILDEELVGRAYLWDPLEEIRCRSEDFGSGLPERNHASLALATGLAMRTLNHVPN